MSQFDGLSNDQLLVDLKELVKRDRVLEGDLITHLGEVEARRLYLERSCSSMFDYCVKELRFSESMAYKRIGVARASRKFPAVAESISRGEIHLSGASMIAPHLSGETAARWLEDARHKTSREVRQLIADRFPREEVRSSVRRVVSGDRSVGLESPGAAGGASRLESVLQSAAAESPILVDPEAPQPEAKTFSTLDATIRKSSTEPLGARRYSIRFTANEKVHDQLQELRALLRHSVPDGDVGEIFGRAIGALLKQVRNRKIGECASPRTSMAGLPIEKSTRHIPVAIRREVWARDNGRCTYESMEGRSCDSRDAIEFHHRRPRARCNEHTVDNIALRCRSHNRYEAELDFGFEHMARFRKGAIVEHPS